MNWTQLIKDFYHGKPDAIQAVCAIITTIIAIPGVAALITSFKTQWKINSGQLEINKQQVELNRLTLESDRRSIRPYFQVDINWMGSNSSNITLSLTNAVAYNFRGISQGNDVVELKLTKDRIDVFTLTMVVDIIVMRKSMNDGIEIPLTTYLIMFNDEAGRAYKQYIYYNGETVWTDLPVLM